MSAFTEGEDIFSQAQTYVYVTIELSEPIYPLPDPKLIRSDANDLLKAFEDHPKFPSTQDAIGEFQTAINYIVVQVAAEYQRANQVEEVKQQASPVTRGTTTIFSQRA